MQVKNSRYISEAIYSAYQQNPGMKLDEGTFLEIVKSVTGGSNYTSPGAQLISDYEDWKKTQPPRELPGSKGLTEENIAYLKENYSGTLSMFGKIDALDTMVEMGIITEREKLEAVMGKIELVAVDPEKLIAAFLEFYPNAHEGPGVGHTIAYTHAGGTGCLTVPNPRVQLPVGTLQNFLDAYLKEHGGEVDYIHGESVTDELGAKPGNIGFKLPAMGKDQLFKTVIADGVLPRKTFSMGHAEDKRYYVEGRKIR